MYEQRNGVDVLSARGALAEALADGRRAASSLQPSNGGSFHRPTAEIAVNSSDRIGQYLV